MLWLLLGCGFRIHRLQLPLGMSQRICHGSGDRHVGPIGPRWRSPEPRPFARHRSPSNDRLRPRHRLQPSAAMPWHAWCRRFCPGGDANCVQPTGEKRPLRFFLPQEACTKSIKFFCCGIEGVFTAWLIDMIMVTGCHRNNVSCDPLGKFALKMQTSRLLISPCERKKYLSGLWSSFQSSRPKWKRIWLALLLGTSARLQVTGKLKQRLKRISEVLVQQQLETLVTPLPEGIKICLDDAIQLDFTTSSRSFALWPGIHTMHGCPVGATVDAASLQPDFFVSVHVMTLRGFYSSPKLGNCSLV